MKQLKKQTGITVFYSYASADKKWRDQLAVHLSQLKRDGLIEEWSDQQILAGADRAQEIDQAIESALIILLLISADFLASDTCYHTEMQHALERHRAGVARVIPIIVRPCDWQLSPFAHLQCLPRNTRPITTWGNRDEAFVTIVQELRKVIEQQQFSRPPLSNRQSQNRARLLKRVHKIWIEGLLDQSLHQAAWMDLHLQEQPDAVENPWHFQIQELDQTPHALPVGTSIVEVYDEADRELLILGEPGSGKTTLLLHLARTLLDRAEADEREPMPIVFNLSSWAQKQGALAMWFVEELKTKYYVPHKMAQDWVEANQVLPLLDGLDEVAKEARVACVQSIANYSCHVASQVGTPLVVCCRSEEYRALTKYLPLQRAVSILPLSDTQVDLYLSCAQGQLEGLKHLLRTDADFAALVHRPLVLSLAALAFQGKHLINFPSEENFPSENNFPGASQEQLLQIVFATYVKRMCKRRGKLPSWMQASFLPWLSFLARQLHQHQQIMFSVENLQPDWLSRQQQRWYQWSLVAVFGRRIWKDDGGVRLVEKISWSWENISKDWLRPLLIYLLVAGVVSGLVMGVVFGPLKGLLMGVGTFLIFGLFINQRMAQIQQSHISPNERIQRSGRKGLLIGLLVGMLAWLIFGWFYGVFFGMFTGALFGLSANRIAERTQLSPNEGIWRSGKNGLLIGLFSGLSIGIFAGLHLGLIGGLSLGLMGGFIGGQFFGLNAFVRHFVLRFFLWHKNHLPWRLIPFLDEATERLLLRKVGGSYIFVHRLLLEYFASLDEPTPNEARTLPEGKTSDTDM